MRHKLIKLLGGYLAEEYQALNNRSKEVLKKEQAARRAAQLELERLKNWRNTIATKLRRAGVKEHIINNLLKD